MVKNKRSSESISQPCNVCGTEIESNDTVFVCQQCEQPFCETCSKEHNCVHYASEDTEVCYVCSNSIENEKLSCDECGEITCSEECHEEHCKDDHIDFDEMTAEEYIKQDIVDNL